MNHHDENVLDDAKEVVRPVTDDDHTDEDAGDSSDRSEGWAGVDDALGGSSVDDENAADTSRKDIA